MRRAINHLRAFLKNKEGAALIEVGLALPIFLTLLTGLVEIGFFLLLTTKLQHAAVSVSDLTTRDETVSEAVLQDIFAAAPQIIAPFPLGERARVIVSAVSQNSSTPARVFWQRQGGGTLPVSSAIGAEGAAPTLPAELTLRNDETIVVTEVFYAYEPFLFPMLDARTLRRVSYFRPRLGALQSVN